jgi:hypothetical protein
MQKNSLTPGKTIANLFSKVVSESSEQRPLGCPAGAENWKAIG